MKRIAGLLLVGLLVFSRISCQSSTKAVATVTSESPADWWSMWLDRPACHPPCWQNITPGVTTKDEATSILENIPGITITYNGIYGVSWDYKTKTEGGDIRMSEDGVVSSIWLGSVSDRKLLVKTIVASYGYPKYIKPYDCREQMCVAALLYPDFGMFLSIFTRNMGSLSDPHLEILPDTTVDRVYFIEKGLGEFQKLPEFQEYDLLMEWNGYGKYP